MIEFIRFDEVDCTQEELETYRKMLDSIGYDLDIDTNGLNGE